MEFKISPFHKNSYPRQGILIKGADAAVWLKEVYAMGLEPEDIFMYALPGSTANKIFGCLVIPKGDMKIADIGRNNYMQCVNNRLYIPENTIVFPEFSKAEWNKQFTAAVYVIHPDTGLAELSEEINWNELINMPEQAFPEIVMPSKSVYIPDAIRSLSIEADEKDLAENIESQIGTGTDKKVPFNMDKIVKGNEKEIDKLLKYLEQHPEMAVELGIPLDVTGTSRGSGIGGSFKFGKNGNGSSDSVFKSVFIILAAILCFLLLVTFFLKDRGKPTFPFFLIFFIARLIYVRLKKDSGSQGSGGGVIVTNRFSDLQEKYEKLAKDFIAKKEYQKAAGIYVKLLKNYPRAAQVLEEGGYYGEAAAIYLKYCKDKKRAAECFEKGRLYTQAIDLYKELNETEKVADLYTALNKTSEANKYYEIVAEGYIKNSQYVKAALIYRKKMNEPLRSQELLLQGWHKTQGITAHNCLNNYFVAIEDVNELGNEIKRFYTEELDEKRKEAFLQVIKLEFFKHEALKPAIKAMAYEIIASCIETTPFIASELIAFNQEDKSIAKDVMKFRALKNKRG